MGSTFEILGSKHPILGSKTAILGSFCTHSPPYVYRVFYGVFGAGNMGFLGFFFPIDLCRAKVRYLRGIMAILGSKSPDLGSKMVPSHPFAALPFIGFFMGFLGSNGGFLGFSPPHISI